MDYDLIFAIGLVLCALSIPHMLYTYSKGDKPHTAAILFIFGTFIIGVSLILRPGDMTFAHVPGLFSRLIDRYF